MPDILLNGGSIPVGYGRFPINDQLFPGLEIESRSRNGRQEQFLVSLDRDTLPAMIPQDFDWTCEEYDETADEWHIVESHEEPIGAIVLLKAQCRTNLRCPMDKDFWRLWVDAGNRRSRETSLLKEKIREDFPKDYDLGNTGAQIILPASRGSDRRGQRDQREYLVAIADKGSFEYIFDRSDGRPNAYRVECRDGQVYLIDPRTEVALSE